MNPNRLTQKAQEAILAAQQETERRQHATMDIDHMLYALVTQEGGVVPRVIERLGASVVDVTGGIESALQSAPKLQYSAQPTISGHLRGVFQRAEDEAKAFGDDYVSTEHLLLAILHSASKSASVRHLGTLGITRDQVL